jgi:hypothetical protein
MNIKDKIKKIGFKDSFIFNKELFKMSSYDMDGYRINYVGNKGTIIVAKTIISRYDEYGNFNKKCLDWLVTELY